MGMEHKKPSKTSQLPRMRQQSKKQTTGDSMSDAFYSTRDEEDRAKDTRKVYTISLNLEEQAELIKDMEVLRQAKEGTALKQLWQIGRAVLHDKKTGQIIVSIFGNERKNKRIGIQDIRAELPSPRANVTQKDELL